ncbi:hypothetical protein OROGR_001657 [Orobanche gracilis]
MLTLNHRHRCIPAIEYAILLDMRTEKILEVDGTVTTQPVLEHVVSNLSFNISSTDVIKLLLPMGDILSEVVLLLQGVPGINATSAALWRTQILYSFIRIIVVGGIGFTFGGSIFANIRISTYKYFHQFLFRDQICCAQRNLQYEVRADYSACACQQKIDGYNGTSFYNFTALYIIP